MCRCCMIYYSASPCSLLVFLFEYLLLRRWLCLLALPCCINHISCCCYVRAISFFFPVGHVFGNNLPGPICLTWLVSSSICCTCCWLSTGSGSIRCFVFRLRCHARMESLSFVQGGLQFRTTWLGWRDPQMQMCKLKFRCSQPTNIVRVLYLSSLPLPSVDVTVPKDVITLRREVYLSQKTWLPLTSFDGCHEVSDPIFDVSTAGETVDGAVEGQVKKTNIFWLLFTSDASTLLDRDRLLDVV